MLNVDYDPRQAKPKLDPKLDVWGAELLEEVAAQMRAQAAKGPPAADNGRGAVLSSAFSAILMRGGEHQRLSLGGMINILRNVEINLMTVTLAGAFAPVKQEGG